MSVLFRFSVAICSLYGLLHALPATAADGRITFTGSIVTPTCVAATEPAIALAGNLPSGRYFDCGATPRSTNDANVSTYRLSVVAVNDETVTGNALLQYFVGYRASMNAPDAKMMTRTYD